MFGQVFLGLTSTKLELIRLAQGHNAVMPVRLKPMPLSLESSALPTFLKDLARGLFVLFDLILYVPSAIFQLNRDGSSWVEPVLS